MIFFAKKGFKNKNLQQIIPTNNLNNTQALIASLQIKF